MDKRVKLLFITVIIFLDGFSTVKADNNLNNSNFVKINQWYIAPAFGLTNVNDKFSPTMSLQGAWLRNRKYFIGFAFYGLKDPVKSTDTRMEWLGAFAGMRFNTEKSSQISIDIGFGSGELSYYYGKDDNPDEFSFIHPRISLNIPLNSISEFFTGISYRYVHGSTHPTITNKDLTGVQLSIGMMFGNFK